MNTLAYFPQTRTRSAARDQFLADVLATACQGIDYWAEFRAFESREEQDEVHAAAYAVIVDDEGDEHTVTLDTIATGWGLYKGETVSGVDYGKQALLANRTNGDDGDYDADVADNVLQLGLFGKIIYG